MSYQPPQAMTSDQAEAWRRSLRHGDDGLDQGYSRPDDVEPLASRLERADRVIQCREMTLRMLDDWAPQDATLAYYPGVWTKGVCIDFLVLTWKGVFCVWSVDHRWTVRQAALVEPARAQIQAELPGFEGKVEAIFHSPREPTQWTRHVLIDPATDEPVEIVVVGGDLARVLGTWHPAGGVGLDPEWLVWLGNAAAPRWWRSDGGRAPTVQADPHDELD
ncbi:MAG: hypothetical protein MSC31_18335 [Solirubrobacteraceae bacterium MAG38_C4-C5]|nr:hypothetical protein [Candidatus Siliceabacter maunaloa]